MPQANQDNFVVVKICESHLEADLAKAYLESEGIETIILSDDAGGMLPTLSMLNGVRVLVPEKSLFQAQNILQKSSDE